MSVVVLPTSSLQSTTDTFELRNADISHASVTPDNEDMKQYLVEVARVVSYAKQLRLADEISTYVICVWGCAGNILVVLVVYERPLLPQNLSLIVLAGQFSHYSMLHD